MKELHFGCTLIEALHEKYMQNEADDVQIAGEVPTSSGNAKNIQLVGIHKIQYVCYASLIIHVGYEYNNGNWFNLGWSKMLRLFVRFHWK